MNLIATLEQAVELAKIESKPQFVVCARDPEAKRKGGLYEAVEGDLVFPEIDRVICRVDVHSNSNQVSLSVDPEAPELLEVQSWSQHAGHGLPKHTTW